MEFLTLFGLTGCSYETTEPVSPTNTPVVTETTEPVKYDSELAAFANYHAYMNAHDGYRAHEYSINNETANQNYLAFLGSWTKYGENNYENFNRYASTSINFAEKYIYSPEHYDCMVRDAYNYVGVSNLYSANGYSTQFDLYIAGTLTTPMYR